MSKVKPNGVRSVAEICKWLGERGFKNVAEEVNEAHTREISATIFKTQEIICDCRAEANMWHLQANEEEEACNAMQERVERLENALRSAARFVVTHDIYGTMGKEIVEEAKSLLNDDGEFLTKGGAK